VSAPGGTGQSLTVVPDDVRNVGNYVYELAETLRSALDSAGREVDALDRTWFGSAASGFSTGWRETSSSGQQIISALTEMAEKLGVTAATYQRQDEAQASALGTFSLDLPGQS
jgi:WXG100 family type VII secretion target